MEITGSVPLTRYLHLFELSTGIQVLREGNRGVFFETFFLLILEMNGKGTGTLHQILERDGELPGALEFVENLKIRMTVKV